MNGSSAPASKPNCSAGDALDAEASICTDLEASRLAFLPALRQQAIAATTVAIERVVLRHMKQQVEILSGIDEIAAEMPRQILIEEQEHHDVSASQICKSSIWPKLLDPIVTLSTEAVIWPGIRL